MIDWASSPAMQNLLAKHKINFPPAHPDVKIEPGLAAVIQGAKIFPIDSSSRATTANASSTSGSRRSCLDKPTGGSPDRWTPPPLEHRRLPRAAATEAGRPGPRPGAPAERRRWSGSCWPCSSSSRWQASCSGPSRARRASRSPRCWTSSPTASTPALWNSLLLGALVGLAGTVIGFFFAFTAVRANLSRRWTTLLDLAIILPLISPPFTTAIAMIFSFGPRGLITYDLLGIARFNVYGLHSTLFAETVTYFPIAYLTLKAILSGIDPSVEDMAFSLGAGRWRVFRTVTLPLTVPGLANAFLLLFAASLADFATPLILAGNSFPVLPTDAYLQITGLFDLKGGAVLSFVLLVPAFVVFLLQRYWVSRKYYVTITGKAGAQTEIKSVSPWSRRLCWPSAC